MKISVVTPCRNAAHRLPRTMGSVLEQSALRDSRVELEYFIIDGASTDGTREVVEKLGAVNFASEPDAGMFDALTKGLQRCTGDIVTYLNAGDVLHPEAFSLVHQLMSDEKIAWLTGSNCKINEAGEVIDFWKPPRFRREYVLNGTYLRGYPHPNIQQEGTFFRRGLLEGMDWDKFRSYKLAGDYFLWTHFAARTELHSVRSILGCFQVHAGQLSEDIAGYKAETDHMIRAETPREKITRHWEFDCPPILKGLVWPHTLGQSKALVFKFDERAGRWITR